MTRPFQLAAALLALATALTPSAAQEVRDPKDKLVARDAAAPASNWKDQPWWTALAECAAAFRREPADKDKFQKFAGYAMMRVADDRGVKAEVAAALVLPWTEGRGQERAGIMIGAFGIGPVRANCDKLFDQYQTM